MTREGAEKMRWVKGWAAQSDRVREREETIGLLEISRGLQQL